MITIQVSAFTKLPGPRYTTQGPHSGQEFREKHLKRKFRQAVQEKEKLLVLLDGVRFGYPTSFLEEAFGGLAREFGVDTVLSTLEFKSAAEPMLIREIQRYIRRAKG